MAQHEKVKITFSSDSIFTIIFLKHYIHFMSIRETKLKQYSQYKFWDISQSVYRKKANYSATQLNGTRHLDAYAIVSFPPL